MKESEVTSIRILWFLGSVCGFSLGLVGLLLPILPHIPFLLFGAFCLSKVSMRFRSWAMKELQKPWAQKYLKPLINRLMRIHWIKRIVVTK